MKNIISILILTLIFTSCAEKTTDYIIISGVIKNAKVDTELSQNSDKLAISSRDKEPIHNILVHKDGTFRDTLHLAEGHYSMYYEGEKAYIYLKPGNELNVKFDIKNFDKTLTFEGKGSIENIYLIQKHLKELSYGNPSLLSLAKLDEPAFLNKINLIKKEMLIFLEEYKNLTKELRNIEQKKIEYEWVNRINRYQDYRRYVLKDDGFTVSKAFPTIPKELYDLENEALLNIKPYQTFILTEYDKLSQELNSEDTLLDKNIAYFKAVIKYSKSPIVKNYLLFKKAMYGINNANQLDDYYNTFIEGSTNDEHKQYITNKYKKLIAKPNKGDVSPSFVNYETASGDTKSLSDFKGKYVYIDIWATWCAPCKKEVPYLKKLEKEYEDKNIEFVSISIDTPKAKEEWKRMVKEENLGGTQLLADKDWKSSFIKKYAIAGSGIPRFILIDPEGYVVDADAPRPSDDKLELLFEKLTL
ncbi:TlpA family protein disulfide reductase [Pontimicrobium aquaticum]|uniref:TlpA family protein disulfide reductase n=1 Tax=Pontimicrobium aquaticum TaxID=2565367 RepID=A0A4U0F0A0_9FLAO|nr:TlpA disulfide reductase family protein [Pontimicrobium aquaticum]TJY37831.1 TlpA family protein disulfide reductase [Pontimicrobium aquaticum]